MSAQQEAYYIDNSYSNPSPEKSLFIIFSFFKLFQIMIVLFNQDDKEIVKQNSLTKTNCTFNSIYSLKLLRHP